MRRALLPLLILAAIVVAAGLAWWTLAGGHWGGNRGGGDTVTETHALPPFHAIDLSGIGDVTLVQGDTDGVTIEAPARSQRLIATRVKDGTLVIHTTDERSGFFGGFGRKDTGRARLTVTFRDLDAIDAAGAVKIAAKTLRTPALKISVAGTGTLRIDDLQTQSLKLSGAGAVKAELAGRAAEQVVSISGAGKYNAAALESDDARVAVSGAGKVVINARKTLKVSLSGAGLVEYLGNPEVKQSVSGIGKVRRHDATTDAPRKHFNVAFDLTASSPVPPAGWSRT